MFERVRPFIAALHALFCRRRFEERKRRRFSAFPDKEPRHRRFASCFALSNLLGHGSQKSFPMNGLHIAAQRFKAIENKLAFLAAPSPCLGNDPLVSLFIRFLKNVETARRAKMAMKRRLGALAGNVLATIDHRP